MEIRRNKMVLHQKFTGCPHSCPLFFGYFDKVCLETLRKSTLIFWTPKMLCKTNACILRAFWSDTQQSVGMDSPLVVPFKEHFTFIGPVDPGMWRWQLKTVWCCYCCWCWCWETCWRNFDRDLEAEVWSRFWCYVWLRFWSWCLVKILKLNFDQKLWYDLSKEFTSIRTLNPGVRCAFVLTYLWMTIESINFTDTA